MKKVISIILVSIISAVSVLTGVNQVFAVDSDICNKVSESELKAAAGCSETRTVNNVVGNATGVLLWAVGVVSVIMIIVAGLKIATSGGNPGAIQKAKMMIIYSLAGLAIAILAYAIANFVIGGF